MEYLDKLAEESVKEAIQKLVTDGKRPSGRNVPQQARQFLSQKGRGRVSPSDAEKRVQEAIQRMKDRKEIKAPTAPNNDWVVIGYQPPSPADSSSER